MKVMQWLMYLLFPPKCILCGKILEKKELDLCRCCRVEAPEFSAGKRKLQFLDSFVAVWYYEGNVRHSLLRYKFYNARNLASGYGRLLAMKLLKEHPEGFDMITWVPISGMRKLRRGYDQCELLACAVGEALDIVSVPTLKKIRNNRQQSRIHGMAQRRANVLGVYQVLDSAQVHGKRILLLDDILTTGATAGEAARVLLTAGASEVHCGVVAAARK